MPVPTLSTGRLVQLRTLVLSLEHEGLDHLGPPFDLPAIYPGQGQTLEDAAQNGAQWLHDVEYAEVPVDPTAGTEPSPRAELQQRVKRWLKQVGM